MNIGYLNVDNFMVGDTQVDRICLGTEEVWKLPSAESEVGDSGCPDGPSIEIYWMDGSVTIDTFCDGIIPNAYYYGQSNIVSVIMGPGITEIGDDAFAGIGANFSGCGLSNTLVYIGDGAFKEAGVIDWSIPASVTGIGMNAFNTRLPGIGGGPILTQHMAFLGDVPPQLIDDNDNLTLGEQFPIYVKQSAESAYKTEYAYYASRIRGVFSD